MKNYQKQRKIHITEDSLKILNDIRTKKSSYWAKEGERKALEIFQEASKRIPAYSAFLKKGKIDTKQIKDINDFKKYVPITDKKDYLKNNKIKDLCWDGSLNTKLVYTSTSGSTGEPFYFCRGSELDWQYSVILESFYQASLNKNEPTLIIVCFGMGVWIGGLITYQAFEILGRRGYPISIITPGINKGEIYKALKNLGKEYKKIIFVGYPPFIKDVIDEATENGVNLKKYNIKLIFAAEAFTEKFRDYLANKTNIKDSLKSTMNIYGSADIGAMAFETPLSILIRRIAMKNKKIFHDIFSPIEKTPTLAQYIPYFINFESKDGEILLTGNNSIPLIRYSLGDHGGTFSFDEINNKLKKYKIDLRMEAKKAGIENLIYELPFVYVYERTDFSTTLYGLQIYPETIKEVLLEKKFNKLFTGKLTLITRFNNKNDQFLEINIEMQSEKKVTPKIKHKLLDSIIRNLKKKNSEFNELEKYLGKRSTPILNFWPLSDPLYFKSGIKQVWVKK